MMAGKRYWLHVSGLKNIWKVPCMAAPVLTWVRVNSLPVLLSIFIYPLLSLRYKYLNTAWMHIMNCISDVKTEVTWCVFIWFHVFAPPDFCYTLRCISARHVKSQFTQTEAWAVANWLNWQQKVCTFHLNEGSSSHRSRFFFWVDMTLLNAFPMGSSPHWVCEINPIHLGSLPSDMPGQW